MEHQFSELKVGELVKSVGKYSPRMKYFEMYELFIAAENFGSENSGVYMKK